MYIYGEMLVREKEEWNMRYRTLERRLFLETMKISSVFQRKGVGRAR